MCCNFVVGNGTGRGKQSLGWGADIAQLLLGGGNLLPVNGNNLSWNLRRTKPWCLLQLRPWMPVCGEVSPSAGPIHPTLPPFPCQKNSAAATAHQSKLSPQCSWDGIALKINSFES